jgi:hypothetical protein
MLSVMLVIGMASSATLSKQPNSADDVDPSSGECLGGSPGPSTLVNLGSAKLLNTAEIIGEDCCFEDGTGSCTAGETEFTFEFAYDGTFGVEAAGGAKISSIGFKAGGTKCLAAYSSEPVKIEGIGVAYQYNDFDKIFACKKADPAALETNLPYTNARLSDPGLGLCEADEAFVGDPDTGRGICVRCLAGSMGPPPPEKRVCSSEGEEEACLDSNVHQIALFDTDTNDGNPFVAECGPSFARDSARAVAAELDSDTEFRQCDENADTLSNGEEKCKAAGEISSGFDYYGGGSGGCVYKSGRRICVSR